MVRRVGFGADAAAVERPQKATAATIERAPAPSRGPETRGRREGRPAPARFALVMTLAALVGALVITSAEGGLEAVGRGLTEALAGERPLGDVVTPYVPALLLLAVGVFVGLFGGRRRASPAAAPAMPVVAQPVETTPTEAAPRRRSEFGRAITGLVLVVWLGLWAAGLVAAYGIFREAQGEPGHGAQFLGFWLVVAALGWLALVRAFLRVLLGR